MTELEQLKQQAQELVQRIEALEKAEKANGVWLPKVGEAYYFKGARDICTTIFDNGKYSVDIVSRQRVYPIRELAEANDHRKETIAAWNKFREMETEAVDWANKLQFKYRIVYFHAETEFNVFRNTITQELPDSEWYTTSLDACEWVIANMQTELKKIWGLP